MQIYHADSLLSAVFLAGSYSFLQKPCTVFLRSCVHRPLIQWICLISLLPHAKTSIKCPETYSQKLQIIFQCSLAPVLKQDFIFFYSSVVGFSFREGSVLGQFDRCSHSKKAVMSRWFHIQYHLFLNSDASGENLGGSIFDASYLTTNLDPRQEPGYAHWL